MKFRLSFDFWKQRRFQVVTLIFVIQAAALYSFSRDEAVPEVPQLRDIPEQISNWRLAREAAIEKEAMAILSPDDYLIRDYVQNGSNRLANLFIAYFKTQKNEKMPHSPKNCLPGNGWVATSFSMLPVSVPGRSDPIQINSYTVRKGDQTSLVLYWYQTWNRILANEYIARVYLALDSIRYNRTDTALVRVMVPVPDDSTPSEYHDTAVDFVRAVYPEIVPYFPKSQ